MRRVDLPHAARDRLIWAWRWNERSGTTPLRSCALLALLLIVLHEAPVRGSFSLPGGSHTASIRRESIKAVDSEERMMQTRTIAVLLGMALGFSAVKGDAAELLVPQAYPTIQSTIDAAAPGDAVKIAAGTYDEQCDLRGKAILLAPQAGLHSVVIRSSVGWSVRATSGETASAAVVGLRFEGAPKPQGYGGGLWIDSSILISDCVISGVRNRNAAGTVGAAVLVTGGSPRFLRCAFENCRDTPGLNGAAVHVGGAGVAPLFENCRFGANGPTAQGADLHTYGDSAQTGVVSLVGCTFDRYSGGGYGTRIYNNGQGGGTFRVIASDCVFEPGMAPATSLIHGWDALQLSNVLFRDCRSAISLITHQRSTLTIDGCTFDSNTATNLVLIEGIQGGTGVVSNSRFCGNTPAAPAYSARLVDGGGNTIEASCAPLCPADIVIDQTVNPADLAIVLNFWGTNGSQFPGVDVNRDGIVNAVDLSAVLGAWGPCPQ
jgi:hypothetical protein